MDNLLTFAVEAHGGLKAWNKLQSLHANVSIGGALWDQKQLPGLFKNTHVELKLPTNMSSRISLTLASGSYLRRIRYPWSLSRERPSTRASTHGQPLPGNPPIPDGTNCMRGISAATRSGVISQRRSFTPILASMRKRLNLGMRTESVGGCCKSPFLTDTRRTLARNTPTSARTGFSEDISTLSMF